MSNYHYLSEKRLAELKEELNNMKTVRRMEVSERLKRAKEFGDLSENAEYSEAREEQDVVESRIEELEDIIKNASIIKKTKDCDTVGIGCEVEASSKGKSRKFTIVGSNEASPEEGMISNESPLGKGLLGKSVGDMVSVRTPAGEVEWKIVKIG